MTPLTLAAFLSIAAGLGCLVAEAMRHPSGRTRAGFILILAGLALFSVYALR